jgi:hypothetical protein
MESSLTDNLKVKVSFYTRLKQYINGIFRSVFWPYEVYKKDKVGEIIYNMTEEGVPEPSADDNATLVARITNLLMALVALNEAFRLLTGYSLQHFIELFSN